MPPRARRLGVALATAATLVFLALHLVPDLPEAGLPVGWQAGSVRIEGELFLPYGPGPHPAAVLVPGHGDWTRSGRLFRRHAERLPALGLAVLLYDKRGCGASGGDWRRVPLARLADDALGALDLLARRPDIDPERLGLIGTSQGGAVALLASLRSPHVAFVATLSLSLRAPREHDAFLVGERVRQAGFSEEDAERAEEAFAAFLAAVRDDAPLRIEEDLSSEPWFGVSGLGDHVRHAWQVDAYRSLPPDLDARSLLLRTRVPVLALQGEEDWVVPGPREVRLLREIAAETAIDLTVEEVPEAGHALWREGAWPLRRRTWPEAYWSALEGWLSARGFVPR